MSDELFDGIMKTFLAQLDSSLKISKIISEHGGEGELSEDSIISGLVYRLMTPMENEEIWAQKSKKGPKMIKKALPREGFRNAFSARRKTL